MEKISSYFTLHNGVKIPSIGFGTFRAEKEEAMTSVKAAIASGYQHIDTAAVYGNEQEIGIAVKESGITRSDLFLTTKLWNDTRGYEETREACRISMEKLGVEYLDLYLIHWPNPIAFRANWKEKNAESWRALEDLYQEGKLKAIGVSNFAPRHLEALKETACIKPMVNQIRLCPGVIDKDTVAYCKKKNILLQAYSPLGTGNVFKIKTMQELAKKYNKSIAQICIRFSLQMGFNPLPKSINPERIKENKDVFDFEISEEDMKIIADLEGCGSSKDPDTITF